MLFCKFCNKECKNKNSLVSHERMCKDNPNKVDSLFKTLNNKQEHHCTYCDKTYTIEFLSSLVNQHEGKLALSS